MNALQMLNREFSRLAELTDQAKQSEEMRKWLKSLSAFWKYSFGNTLLIAIQRPDATTVAGLRTWNKLGRRVRKGEKGIAILVPVLVKARKDEEKKAEKADEAQAEAQEDDPLQEEPAVAFRVGYVFDISQTEGDPLPTMPQWWVEGDCETSLLERIKSAIQADGIIVAEVPSLGGPKGASMGGKIVLLEDLTPLGKAEVLLHEWAHEIRRRGDLSSETVEEVIADSVAFVVLNHFGYEPSQSATYVALWEGGRDLLRQNMLAIKQVASVMLSKLDSGKLELEVEHEVSALT